MMHGLISVVVGDYRLATRLGAALERSTRETIRPCAHKNREKRSVPRPAALHVAQNAHAFSSTARERSLACLVCIKRREKERKIERERGSGLTDFTCASI